MTRLPYPPHLAYLPRPHRQVMHLALCAMLAWGLTACKKAEKEEEVIAPVRVAPAIKGSIRLIVNADAVLFPRDQANIVP